MKSHHFVIIILFVLVIPAFSQPGGGGNPGSGDPVPISGIEILIAAGGLLGLRKLFSKKKAD